MKKVLLVMATALFVASAWAQQPDKYPSFKGFVNNGFWDNWEISIGGGINAARGGADKKIQYELNGSLTKWFNPVVGVRGMLTGGYYGNVASSSNKFGFVYGNFDAMINFSNWAGGYREDRVYYAVPFAGAGVFNGNNLVGRNWVFGIDAGLLNKFRVCPAVDINLELKGLWAMKSATPANFDGRFFALSATIGATYRFNRRDWERRPVGNVYSDEQIRAYQQAVDDANGALNAAKAENARLAKELKNAQDEANKAKAALNAAPKTHATAAQQLDPSTLILYRIGTSTLTAEEKVRLDLKADLIKNGPKDQVYTIEGHADPQTGTAAINQRLSEKRAKAVYDYLVKKGVNPDQLRYEGMGDKNNPYNNQVANRAAIIK